MAPGQPTESDLQRRGIVPGACVRVSGESVRVAVPHQAGAACQAEPQVEVIREGDLVQAIDVLCTCGKRIRLHCVYDK